MEHPQTEPSLHAWSPERLPLPAAGGSSPRFAVIERQPPRPAAILLAVLLSAGALVLAAVGLAHSQRRSLRAEMDRIARGSSASADDDDDKDDPNQVDVVYLGDPADAPEPSRRPAHYRAVHPTIAIRLPRFGKDEGLIPDSSTGRLLYAWLAAFNQGSDPALRVLLPADSIDSQMDLRRQTGGFRLLSASEVSPGVVVFRLQDQTPVAGEALGTIMLRPGSTPPAVQSFSLRGVPAK